MIDSEKNKDNNYKDFDVLKMNKILLMKTKIQFIHTIFVLKDGRIIIYGGGNYDNLFRCAVFNLKTGSFFNLKLGSNYDYDFIQMDDETVIARTGDDIKLINIKENEIEIIQTIPSFRKKMFKLSNQKILALDSFSDLNLFIYENKKLLKTEVRILKIFKKYDIEGNNIWLINENEFAFTYAKHGYFSDSYYIGFFNIEKDEKIKNYDCSINSKFCLINTNMFIFEENNKIHPINLKDHTKKKGDTI